MSVEGGEMPVEGGEVRDRCEEKQIKTRYKTQRAIRCTWVG